MRRLLLLLAVAGCAWNQELRLPNHNDSVRFAIIGDAGTGDRQQYEVADQMARYRRAFPFNFVIVLGDNMYGGEGPRDFVEKFEKPYKALLDAGVKFYASLGNHDNPNQRFYKHFNMGGERYYSFKPKDGVRFFALDSTYMGPEQLQWLEKELAGSGSEWKICFFHHPLYSSGKRHGPDDALRGVLEPLFLKHGVDVVFAGHEHFYERLKPQKGIQHFIMGASGKLRRGNIRKMEQTAAGFDQDHAFMIAEINKDSLWFQTITRKGETVDFGVIRRSDAPQQLQSAGAAAAGATR